MAWVTAMGTVMHMIPVHYLSSLQKHVSKSLLDLHGFTSTRLAKYKNMHANDKITQVTFWQKAFM